MPRGRRRSRSGRAARARGGRRRRWARARISAGVCEAAGRRAASRRRRRRSGSRGRRDDHGPSTASGADERTRGQRAAPGEVAAALEARRARRRRARTARGRSAAGPACATSAPMRQLPAGRPLVERRPPGSGGRWCRDRGGRALSSTSGGASSASRVRSVQSVVPLARSRQRSVPSFSPVSSRVVVGRGRRRRLLARAVDARPGAVLERAARRHPCRRRARGRRRTSAGSCPRCRSRRASARRPCAGAGW